ncbi:MAG TPA: glycosyltransferase family 4 protein, partial [Gaiellaceae bacterium]|nr:glycosyltransferase family 4 protein [Gaiellaceae bacterium]
MRILVATDHWSPDHRGGAARVAAETASLLARRGHDVDVIAPAVPGRPRLWRDDSLVVHRVLPRSVLPQTLSDPVQTYLAARAREADLAVAHTSTTAIGLSLALRRTPLAVVFHASAAREAAFERSRTTRTQRRAATALLEPVLRLLERSSLRRAERVLVLSEFSRSLL